MTESDTRVLVTGSRDWSEADFIATTLDIAASSSLAEDKRFVLVHGGCPTGADASADHWGKRSNLCDEVEVHPADWGKHGKRAGFVRNAEMVDKGATFVYAFVKNGSKGTMMTVKLALKAGIPVFAFVLQGSEAMGVFRLPEQQVAFDAAVGGVVK